MTNVTEITKNVVTPEEVITHLLDNGEEIQALVCVVVRKDGFIDFPHSDLSPAMLSHLALALQSECMDRMKDGAE
jgi:hypothetical protein